MANGREMVVTAQPMRIRWATENDVPSLARVHAASWRDVYGGIVPDSVLKRSSAESRMPYFRQMIPEGPEETALIEEDGEVIGFVTAGCSQDSNTQDGHTGEIWGIYIAPDHWRKGVGRQLARWALAELGVRGYDIIVLWVLEQNDAARHFYEALGFTRNGTTKQVDIGVPLRAIRYRKPITPRCTEG